MVNTRWKKNCLVCDLCLCLNLHYIYIGISIIIIIFCFLLEMLNNKEKILFLKNIVNIRLKIFHLSCVSVNKIKFPVSVE